MQMNYSDRNCLMGKSMACNGREDRRLRKPNSRLFRGTRLCVKVTIVLGVLFLLGVVGMEIDTAYVITQLSIQDVLLTSVQAETQILMMFLERLSSLIGM